MLGKASAVVLALLLATPAAAFAEDWRLDDRDHPRRHHDSHNSWSSWVDRDRSTDRRDRDQDRDRWDDDGGSDSSSDGDSAEPGPAGGVVLDGTAQTITAELTGYSYQDNSPPGSADICCPVLHQKAGGTGTYEDPITTAVPGSGGRGMETPAGTRLYIEKLRRYFLVEDSGATGTGKARFDLWVGGQGFSKSDSDACMNSLTGDAEVILNPAAGLAVTVGELTVSGGCKI